MIRDLDPDPRNRPAGPRILRAREPKPAHHREPARRDVPPRMPKPRAQRPDRSREVLVSVPSGRVGCGARATARWGRHRLAPDSVEALRTTGTFGVVDGADLAGSFRSKQRARTAIAELRDAGLLRVERFHAGRRRVEAVTLTRAGKRLMERHVDPREPGDEHARTYRAGPARRAQALHDTAVYRAVRREAEAIEARGGRVLGIRTEADLQRLAWRRIDRAVRAGKCRQDAKAAAAAELGLGLHAGKLAFPDARVEYGEAAGAGGGDRCLHRDVEVVTRDYREPALRAKQAAGFRMHSMEPDGSLRAGGER